MLYGKSKEGITAIIKMIDPSTPEEAAIKEIEKIDAPTKGNGIEEGRGDRLNGREKTMMIEITALLPEGIAGITSTTEIIIAGVAREISVETTTLESGRHHVRESLL